MCNNYLQETAIKISIRFSVKIYNNLKNIEDILWDREEHWQSQLFTIAKGMNGILDLYSSKKKGCRKC